MGIAKSIDPGKPAQSNHGRKFSLLADFLCNFEIIESACACFVPVFIILFRSSSKMPSPIAQSVALWT